LGSICGEITGWDENRKPIKEPTSFTLLPTNLVSIFGQNEDDCGGKIWVDGKLRNQRRFEETFKHVSNFAYLFRAQINESGKVLKDIRFLFREENSQTWLMGFKAPVRNELMQSAIIPSFRDPQNQLRLSSYSWFGKLMKHLLENKITPQMTEALEKVQVVANEIFEGVISEIKNTSLDIAFPGTQLQIRFNADSHSELYKSCQLFIDDGINTPLTDKGSGIQSAAIIGLFNYYTKYVNTASAALLCVEEPEIYLHPHARRVISDRLDGFLDNYRNQVIITTHCSEFIRTTSDDFNIIMVQKTTTSTTAVPIKISKYKKLLLDNNQNELFFLEKVIVCEGYDGYLLKIAANYLYPGEIDKQNISIVSVGGKDNIQSMIELVLEAKIKCFVFADFDFLIRDNTGDHAKFINNFPAIKTHRSIADIPTSFFKQECIFGSMGSSEKKKLIEIRKWIKQNREVSFYTATNSRQIRGIPKAFCLATTLKRLQQHGICILKGDVESLFIDDSSLRIKRTKRGNFKKMDLETIYQLNNSIIQKPMEQIIEMKQIQRFLKSVLQK
jgi:predicted ATP-dependent endonuclease of OLD family